LKGGWFQVAPVDIGAADQCPMSGGKSGNLCSLPVFRSLIDAVEKVRSMSLARNNRTDEIDLLNRSCAFYPGLESILLGDPAQNPFSTASIQLVHLNLAGQRG
jgi:hypothetical protein